MTVLGISVYPDMDSLDEIKAYFELASKYGVTKVFTSMFSVEGTKEEVLDYFREMLQSAHQYNMRVSLDVNPDCFALLGADYDDLSVFKSIDADILRMDLSYGVEKDAILVKNPYGIQIEFSTMHPNLAGLIDLGVDPQSISVCHNFYPLPYTGAKWNDFLNINAKVKALNIPLAAFVSSHAEGAHGVWDAEYGLPTVERMRHMPIDLQARIMLATHNVDEILIGNAFASEEEFIALQNVLQQRVTLTEGNPFIRFMKKSGLLSDDLVPVVVKVNENEDITELEKEVLYDFGPHLDFGDGSEWIWRSRNGRMIYNKKGIPARTCEKKVLEVGDVIIVNDNYLHYSGEVHVVLIPMKKEKHMNLVGHIDPDEMILIELCTHREIVKFVKA